MKETSAVLFEAGVKCEYVCRLNTDVELEVDVELRNAGGPCRDTRRPPGPHLRGTQWVHLSLGTPHEAPTSTDLGRYRAVPLLEMGLRTHFRITEQPPTGTKGLNASNPRVTDL